MHPLDHALRLEAAGTGRLRGEVPHAYWNMVGPYGGITAAIVLDGVLRDARHIGEPLVLTVNYCAPVRDAPFELVLRLARTNRSTQHWSIEMQQADAKDAGAAPVTVVQAQVVMGVRRALWSHPGIDPPSLPAPETLRRRLPREGIRWFENYDIRLERNPMNGDEPDAPVCSWLRDDPPRPLDYPALAGLADTFFPGIFAHRKAIVPIATVSMNVYFHTTADELAAIGGDWLSGRTGSGVYRGGFFDCASQIWHRESLIATTQQVVWYRD